MASSASARKQIVENIKEATNILITVSRNPSVDELSAALALTIFLNDLEKHATAVFSGEVPPAISFLEPGKTFEQNADSLRDFIVALDKEKADHLRYKVVDDAVKIFITPYRTTISEQDLEFSQGDYNVDFVLALNVASNDFLDEALSAHGKILHGATVATITANDLNSKLGSIDWHEQSVSGMSEMVADIISELKTAKVSMSEQVATALLTGVVATTDRFSNAATSPKTMTAAAELLAAGANQQLIAAQLEQHGEIQEDTPPDTDGDNDKPTKIGRDGTARLSEGQVTKLGLHAEESPVEASLPDDSLIVEHSKQVDDEYLDSVAQQTRSQQQDGAAKEAQKSIEQHKRSLEPARSLVDTNRPLTGGVFNATSSQAAEDSLRSRQLDQNRIILSHDDLANPQDQQVVPAELSPEAHLPAADLGQQFIETPITHQAQSGYVEPLVADESPLVPLGEVPPDAMDNSSEAILSALSEDTDLLNNQAVSSHQLQPELAAQSIVQESLPLAAEATMPTAEPTLADIEAAARQTIPSSPPLPPMPPMPDFSTLPPLPDSHGPGLSELSGGGMPVSPIQPPEFNSSAFQIPNTQQ